MLRRFSIPLLVLAALLAAEPLLHSHPLQQNSVPGPCAVCATGVGRMPLPAPAIAAPRLVVYTLTAQTVSVPIVPVVLNVPARAPPVL
ncbi:MAG: hypothetical protein M3041_12210 [Acidobacteriota bacterium]|nr:hypothetical protein [Acidobacteriota bacterium]